MPRRTRWLDDFATLTPAASGQASAELDTPLQGELHTQGFTLVRSLVRVYGIPTTLGTNASITYGLAMVDGDAIAAGALPDPAGVEEIPWVLHDRMTVQRDADAGQQYEYRTYDLRGMRKYTGNSGLQFIADADSNSAWALFVSSRLLVMIP